MTKYYRKIGKFFTPKIIKLLLDEDIREIRKFYKELRGAQLITEQENIGGFFEACYKILSTTYRNEYVFKNTFIQEIFFQEKSGSLYSELQINDSKLDLACFGNSSQAFEIKTELDNLERLDHQIVNYQKVFDYVSVISVENKINSLLEKLDKRVGVFILNSSGKIQLVREASLNIETFDKNIIFSLYHKKEYLSLIQKYFSHDILELQKIPNTKIYAYALDFFSQLPLDTIRQEFLINMKKRKEKNKKSSIILDIPRSLDFLALSHHWNDKEIESFNKAIRKKI